MTDKTEAQRLADAEHISHRVGWRREAAALLRRWPDAGEPVAWTTMPDSDDWMFISGRADPNGRLPGKWLPLYTAPPAERGHVVVTRTPDGHLAAVTRQDDEHRILSVVADTNSLRERIAALEAALEQARVALGEIEYSNDSRWQSDRATEALRAIEEVRK